MQYSVVFDVIESGYRQWWFAASGFVFIAVGVVLVAFRRFLAPRNATWFPFAFLGFAIIWTVFSFGLTFRDYYSLASALRDHRCAVTEGIVSEFHPMPSTGHEDEWFIVDGRYFHYSDFVVSAGFNNSASHGGPIREGIHVRVHHVENDIARLEVSQ